MSLRFFILLVLCFSGLSCSLTRQPRSSLNQLSGDFNVQPESLTPDTFWTYFVGTWQDPSYRGYIKFSITVDERGQFTSLIWHPSSFKYHAEHLTTLPTFAGLTSKQLDAISLYENGRRVLLGTLLIPNSVEDYNHPDLADIQIMGSDPLQPELVASVFDLLKGQMPVPPRQLFYLPVAEQMTFVAKESARFQSLGITLASRTSEQNRICYNAGWGVGHVRVVKQGELDALLAAGAITANDILVMDDVPRELPVVAGIVVSQTSSPSSHPALLAGMLGIPFVYEKNATQLESWNQLAQSQSPVFFQATGDAVGSCQFLVRGGAALTADEASRLIALKKPLPLVLNDYDHSLTQPLNLDQLSREDADKVGAKAANVAELRRIIPGHTVAEGLALPVGLFAEAMQTAQTADGRSLKTEVDQELERLLTPGVSSQATAEGLARVRGLIEKAKLPQTLQNRILDAISSVFPQGTRIKLRSSSNIEDHPEFNGAGLYESKGACTGDDTNKGTVGLCEAKKDPVIKSTLKVWASLYTLKAWVARRYYGVNEQYSGMGILVQRSFKGELANGVAISGYPAYNNEGDTPQTIEVQSTAFPGEDLEVANPPAGKIPETTLITAMQIELQIASTEVARGRMLMSDHLYRQLYEQMAIVHEHYMRALKPKDPGQFKLDMEWKLVENQGVQQIVIKQVRPVPMKISSTQGLDRGQMLVGERQAKLCPSPSENRPALSKLQLSQVMELSIGLQEVPADDRLTMPNPLESLSIGGQSLSLRREAQVQYTAWESMWGTRNEYRTYTVSVPVALQDGTYELQWSGRQERALAQPRLLLNSVQSIWSSDLRLRLSAEDFQDYQLVLGQATCESDAFQGFQPGSFQASSPYAQERSAPVDYSESFASNDKGSYELIMKGRTSFQGFDKTRFMHLDQTTIRGLLTRDLIITVPFKVVYAPGHHNFSFEYALDVMAADGLTDAEKSTLQKRGIQRLVVRTVSQFGDIGMNLPMMASEADFSDETRLELVAIDAQVQAKVLGSLKQTSKTDLFDSGSGFGIGVMH
ncbi:MAG TPA: PEP/pyruvate-binding domain-containing protein [Oligoflexus sp.]|uniref:PEP/pyruvate-binding domain-containing protein n=1 Tax=Oligoflexus sp. TaxID=1971216 RepID=UPI002D2852CA|nr:PEP/pyruvate-binding domain-containing protein [Oligoflexus sp.]HYX34110.1 PEP/pyruvate-binding domain-containing protein [Oligoflexus sp.]